MIQGLRFDVPGTMVKGFLLAKAEAAKASIEESRTRAELYKELEAKLKKADDCSPKINEDCFGKSERQWADQWELMASWIDTDKAYSLTSGEVTTLMNSESYHNTNLGSDRY